MESQYKRFRSKYGAGSYSSSGKKRTNAAKYQLSAKRQAVRSVANTRTAGYIGLERKFFDTQTEFTMPQQILGSVLPVRDLSAKWENAASTGTSAAPQYGVLNAPTRGTGPTQRDGRQYRLKSCLVSGCVRTDTLIEADSDGVITIYLVLDKQSNALAPSVNDIFINPNLSDGVSKNNVMMAAHPYRDLAHITRFRVLAQQRLVLRESNTLVDSAGTAYVSAMHNAFFSFSVNLKDLQVNCVGDEGTLSDISDHALYLVACRDGSNPSAYHISANNRIRFVG